MNTWISLVCFLIALLTAHALSQLKVFHFLAGRNSRFESIDGLRGFLAISVFFHHFVITYYWKTVGIWQKPPEISYQNYGKVGVALFFMITGFLFISKLSKSKEAINWFHMFESRVFRIVPLYLLVIVIITFIVFSNTGYETVSSAKQLIEQYFRWMIFHGGRINNFSDTNLIIAWVDWSLKYEWLFYLSLPILSSIILLRNMSIFILLLIACLVFFLYPIKLMSFSSQHFILFGIGGMAVYLKDSIKLSEKAIKGKHTSLITLLVSISVLLYPNTLDIIHLLLMSFLFVLIVLGNDMFGLFTLKSSVLLGEVSYSVYLLHGAILYLTFTTFEIVSIQEVSMYTILLVMPVLTALVVIVSALTFLLIERPFVTLGRKYIVSTALNSIKRNISRKIKFQKSVK